MNRDAESFNALYAEKGDPWQYETSGYEADKYRRCLNLLPRERYGAALEVGCSIGVMSQLIAARCDHLRGLDFAPLAVDAARRRGILNARFEVKSVPADWPDGPWDLIVLSEVLYYLTEGDLNVVASCIARDLSSGGACLMVGYTGKTDTELTAKEAHDVVLENLARAIPVHRLYHCEGASWHALVFERGP